MIKKILAKNRKNIGQTRKNDDARRKTHEGKMIKEKMMIEKRENVELKEPYKIVFWEKKENRKKKV